MLYFSGCNGSKANLSVFTFETGWLQPYYVADQLALNF